MQKIFTCDGYDFWRDDSGHWNVAHKGDSAPCHCAYATPDAIAKLKGVTLRAGMEWHRSEYVPNTVRDAAPDMLEALKAVLSDAYEDGEGDWLLYRMSDGDGEPIGEPSAIKKVREAIAKAEGRV